MGAFARGPSLQLGTLSTHIANLLCIIHSALARLSCPCRAYARRPCAHCRAWRPSAARRQTRDARQTRLTNQPTSQPFCQYPAVSWELFQMMMMMMMTLADDWSLVLCVQAVPGFLMIFGLDGKILYISDNVCDYLGNSAVCLSVFRSLCLSVSFCSSHCSRVCIALCVRRPASLTAYSCIRGKYHVVMYHGS